MSLRASTYTLWAHTNSRLCPQPLKARGICAIPLPGRPAVLRGWGRAGTAAQPTANSPQSLAGPSSCALKTSKAQILLGKKAVFWGYLSDQIISSPDRRNFPPILPTDGTSAEDTELSVLCLGRRPCLRVLSSSERGETLQNTLSKSVCFNSRLNALKSPTYVFSEKMAKQ